MDGFTFSHLQKLHACNTIIIEVVTGTGQECKLELDKRGILSPMGQLFSFSWATVVRNV